jgi:hypothetical protein
MDPDDGSRSPSSMESVVVFPAPLPPSKAVIVPCSKPKETLSTAITEENDLVRFSVCKIMIKKEK